MRNSKIAPLFCPFENADVTTKLFTDNFAGKEPYASSIWVDGVCFLQCSEGLKQELLVRLFDSWALILHNHREENFSVVVSRLILKCLTRNFYRNGLPSRAELDSVWERVEKNLLVIGCFSNKLRVLENFCFVLHHHMDVLASWLELYNVSDLICCFFQSKLSIRLLSGFLASRNFE